MKNQTVLISGASIAGPALAFWLHRYGFTPTVVERAPALRDGGYAVDFRGASMQVLERVGILADVEREQTHMGSVTYVDAGDRKVAEMPSVFLSGEVEILRGDLSRILYDRTVDDVEYLFGDSIARLDERPDGVHVTFDSGAERTFDLVVGADGLHSNVRSLAFGPEASYADDLGYYVGIFTTDNHLDLDYAGRFFSAPGRTVGMHSSRGNAEAKALFYFASPPLTYDRRDQDAQKRILADSFAGLGWEVPRLLDAMWKADDFYFDSISQINVDRLSKGRIVLLGDAGYCASPLSGMGTGLAIVGAYVLAGELAAAGGDHRVAFSGYEEQMRPITEACKKQGKGGGAWWIPASRAMIMLRNLNYRLLPYLPWRKLIADLPLKAANAITLKTYETLEVPAR